MNKYILTVIKGKTTKRNLMFKLMAFKIAAYAAIIACLSLSGCSLPRADKATCEIPLNNLSALVGRQKKIATEYKKSINKCFIAYNSNWLAKMNNDLSALDNKHFKSASSRLSMSLDIQLDHATYYDAFLKKVYDSKILLHHKSYTDNLRIISEYYQKQIDSFTNTRLLESHDSSPFNVHYNKMLVDIQKMHSDFSLLNIDKVFKETQNCLYISRSLIAAIRDTKESLKITIPSASAIRPEFRDTIENLAKSIDENIASQLLTIRSMISKEN